MKARMRKLNSTAVGRDLDIPEERTEYSDGESAPLLRGLLGLGTSMCFEVVLSDETSSTPFGANKGPEAPGSASSDSNVITAQSDVNSAL